MQPEIPSGFRERVVSIDVFRGLVMLLMLGEALRLSSVARAFPESGFWSFLAYHQSHVAWVGCSLHDLIQPSFSFLVGVVVPYSLLSRRRRGQTTGGIVGHAAWRAFLLVGLGIFFRSINRSQTYFTFEDTLTQIGLGYFFLVLVGLRGWRVQVGLLVAILVGYWLAFALYPLPGADFDWAKAGVAADWQHHLSGFAAHWNKNANLAWAFDTWFLNLFPRESVFAHNGGGYVTLSFIPTLGTMVMGLLAGSWLRSETGPLRKVQALVGVGLACLAVGWLLGVVGVCPVVKRIWTPSWVLFSGGWCLLGLAGFYGLMDGLGFRAWGFPLVVVGMNSIMAYSSEFLFVGFIHSSLHTHLSEGFFEVFGAGYRSLVEGACVLGILWLFLFWMYRRKLFLRI